MKLALLWECKRQVDGIADELCNLAQALATTGNAHVAGILDDMSRRLGSAGYKLGQTIEQED